MPSRKADPPPDSLEPLILVIRNQRVILDADLAKCGKTEGRQEFVNEVFDIDGKAVQVENIPAIACTQCGESVFSRETTEKVRRMVHGEAKPVTSIQMGVFAFS